MRLRLNCKQNVLPPSRPVNPGGASLRPMARRVHLVGICGTGMGSLAGLFRDRTLPVLRLAFQGQGLLRTGGHAKTATNAAVKVDFGHVMLINGNGSHLTPLQTGFAGGA